MSKREGGNGAHISKETRELVARRTEELEAMTAREEKNFIQGKWTTDNSVMRYKAAKRRELHSRQAPRRVAKAQMYTKPDDTDNGIELEDREVADRVTQRDIHEGVTDVP